MNNHNTTATLNLKEAREILTEEFKNQIYSQVVCLEAELQDVKRVIELKRVSDAALKLEVKMSNRTVEEIVLLFNDELVDDSDIMEDIIWDIETAKENNGTFSIPDKYKPHLYTRSINGKPVPLMQAIEASDISKYKFTYSTI